MNIKIFCKSVFGIYVTAFLFFILMATGQTAIAQSITTTEIQDCVVEDEMECDSKMVTTVPVSFGLSSIIEFLDPGTEPGDPSPIWGTRIEIEKTQPRFIYPLIYDHTILYDAGQEDPESGYDGVLSFAGYRIGQPSMTYEVKLTVSLGGPVKIFRVTPESPYYSSRHDPGYQGDLDIKVAIAGDSLPSMTPPDFSNHLVFIPEWPVDHPYVKDYPHHMLLVPREEVSFKGTECDKAGYIPKNTAKQIKQDCLDNQLYDMLEADLSSLNTNPNLDTDYLVSGKRIFKRSMKFIPDMEYILVIKPFEILNTQVAITTEPADIRRVITESTGVIVGAYVDPFESHSNNGTMVVEISNSGGLKTNYIVTVTECDFQIVEAIPAQARTLFPRNSDILHFDIFPKYSLIETNVCKVKLMSQTGNVYDGPLEVFFDTVHYTPDLQIPSWHLPDGY